MAEKDNLLLSNKDIIPDDEYIFSIKKYGSIRSVSIKMNDQSDVDNVLKLIAIKHKLK